MRHHIMCSTTCGTSSGTKSQWCYIPIDIWPPTFFPFPFKPPLQSFESSFFFICLDPLNPFSHTRWLDWYTMMESSSSTSYPTLVSSPTNIWTIHDVILDSPVWKSNIIHLEEQIDQFEKWVDGFTKALKQFIDAVISKVSLLWHIQQCKHRFL